MKLISKVFFVVAITSLIGAIILLSGHDFLTQNMGAQERRDTLEILDNMTFMLIILTGVFFVGGIINSVRSKKST